MNALVPCQGCQRHIRVDHASCPFCEAAVPAGFAKRVIPRSQRRLDRLAYFTFATTLVVSACGEVEEPNSPNNSGGGDAAVADAAVADGQVATDGGKADAKINDGGPEDDGGMQAAYGIPIDAMPFDANQPDGNTFDVNVQPPYGLPPLDSGTD